jgi:hypothetical protein
MKAAIRDAMSSHTRHASTAPPTSPDASQALVSSCQRAGWKPDLTAANSSRSSA